MYFCSGLNREIRTFIEPKFSDFTSYDQMLEKACEVERTCRGTTPATPMAPLTSQQQPPPDYMRELQSLKEMMRKMQTGSSRPQQQQPQQASGGARGPPGPDLARRAQLNTKIQKSTSFKFCNKCKQWGKHITPECRATKTQISALTPQDPSSQPPESTPLTDWFWDGKPTSTQQGN